MPWDYIRRLIGPGMLWGKTKEELQAAIKTAEAAGQTVAAEHLKRMLARRNEVMFD